MPFILNDEAFLDSLKNIDKVKATYEEKTGAKLSDPSPSAFWTTFGYNDTTTRNSQINSLVWLFKHFENHLNLVPPPEFKSKTSEEPEFESITPKEQEELAKKQALELQNRKLSALRVLTGACIYIMETNKSGELKRILKKILGINSTKEIDTKTRGYCLNAVKEHFTSIKDAKSYGNYGIEDKDIDFAFFSSFFEYAKTELSKSFTDDFPFAKLASLTLAWPMSMLGYSVGAFVGQSISRSTSMQNTQWTVTAAIGSLLYFVAGPTGIALIAPTIASQTISNACGLTAAWTMGKAGEALGVILGTVLGLPLDLTLKLAKYLAISTIDMVWSSSSGDTPPPEKGVSLIDGSYHVGGVKVELVDISKKGILDLKDVKVIDPSFIKDSKLLSDIQIKLSDVVEKEGLKPSLEQVIPVDRESETTPTV